MRLIFINIILSLLFTNLHAQNQYDAQWVLGIDLQNQTGAGTLLQFTPDGPNPTFLDKQLDMFAANSCMSNKEGELLFYSNGCEIHNANHKNIEENYLPNPNLPNLGWCSSWGSPFQQSMISLPWPGIDDQYAIFHQTNHDHFILNNDPYQSGVAAYTFSMRKVDMTLGNNLARLVERETILLEDTLGNGYVQAAQHSNGRDWWILVPELNSNCYYRFLFTQYGITRVGKQCIGEKTYFIDHSGQSVFSPNGKKYARYSSLTGIFIYDFDRCEGLLSNPLLIDGRDINSFTYGAAISPNSRFLYTTQNTKVFQFDLTADDIEASEVQIAEYDDYANPNPTYFGFLQLAPDNKIYGTGSQLFPFLHVIHQPNEKGLACQFEQRGLTLPTDNDASLPNFPHFRPDNANDHCRQLPELILDASPACIGETFKVTLISQYLDRTLSLDAKIIWDASVLQLDEATLLIQQEGWNIDSTDPVQGELLISWQDDSGQGISLPDYEDILELQFLVIGGDGDQANLRFAEMPQIEQLVNGQATEEDILLVEPPLFLDALNLAQQEVSPVQEENDGTISIQVQGGTPPYFYSWNTNDSLPTLSELSAGDYYCTITDYGGCILEIGPITVDQIVGLEETYLVAGIQVFPNPSDGHLSINFPTKQTGRLLIRDMQGQTIRSQSFSQRQELQLTEQLPAGLYIATIQRENQASQSVKLLISH